MSVVSSSTPNPIPKIENIHIMYINHGSLYRMNFRMMPTRGIMALRHSMRHKIIPKSKLSIRVLNVKVTSDSVLKNTFVCIGLCAGGDLLAQVSYIDCIGQHKGAKKIVMKLIHAPSVFDQFGFGSSSREFRNKRRIFFIG